MRFIIREQDFEKPLAAGVLRTQIDGQETNILESWRLTAVTSGYTFLRVDIDGREGSPESDYLFHLTLSPQGSIERIKFRHFIYPAERVGDILLSNEGVALSHSTGEDRYEQMVERRGSSYLWFPGALGLAMLLGQARGQRQVPGIFLNAKDGFVLEESEVIFEEPSNEEMAIGGRMMPVHRHSISWRNQRRLLWVDEGGWPVRLHSSAGVTAVETRYVRYG